jgi:hypothetical protein
MPATHFSPSNADCLVQREAYRAECDWRIVTDSRPYQAR